MVWKINHIIRLLNVLTFLNIITPAAKVYNLPKDWFSRNPLEWASPALPLPIPSPVPTFAPICKIFISNKLLS